MATANVAFDFSNHDEPEVEPAGNEMTDPYTSDEVDLNESAALRRLDGEYRGHGSRPRRRTTPSDTGADLMFSALPTVAFSVAAVGVIIFVVAIMEGRPALLLPGAVTAIIFAMIGWLSNHIKSMIKGTQTKTG